METMNLTHSTPSLRYQLVALVFRWLPDRVKRMIFVVTLMKKINGIQSINPETLKRLNEIMHLSACEDSMQLPIQLANVIWRGKSGKEICSEAITHKHLNTEQMHQVVCSIKENTGSWLCYGKTGDMDKDLMDLLKTRMVQA